MRSLRTAMMLGLLAATAAPAHDDILGTRYVATTGVDEGHCDHGHAPCRTIGYALTHTPGGGTVKVAAGLYSIAGLDVDGILHGNHNIEACAS